MKVFDHPNTYTKFVCPICGTGDDKPVVLIPIDGTEKDGIMEARQYHLDCIKLTEFGTANKKMPTCLEMVFIEENE